MARHLVESDIGDKVGLSTICFGWSFLNPSDATTYIPSPVETSPTASTASNQNRQVKLLNAASKFILYFTTTQSAGTGESVQVELHNITKATSAVFTDSLVLTATLADVWETTLSCDAGDKLEIHFVCPTWVTNPTAWRMGAYLTF